MRKGKVRLNCKICGKIFYVIHARRLTAKFHNEDCRRTACGKFIEKYHWKSGSQHPDWKGGKIGKVCPCGNTFYIKPSEKKRRHCDKECESKYNRGENNPRWLGSKVTCANCGVSFLIKRSRLKKIKTGKAFHNNQCRLTFNKSNKVKRICQQCGTVFYRMECQLKKPNSGKFHNSSCRSIYMKVHQRGKVTNIEKVVSNFLKENNIPFEFQYPLLNKYVVDFYLPQYAIAIESDGDYYHSFPKAIERDKRKSGDLINAGYAILRFKEKDLMQHKNHKHWAECRYGKCLNGILGYITYLKRSKNYPKAITI